MGLPVFSVLTGAPSAGAVSSGDDGNNDSSGWLSGLGDLFSGVGTAVAAGLKASNVPNAQPGSGFVYNPATGQYYNPVTGQALTSTGTLTSAGGLSSIGSNSTFILIALALIGFLLIRRR